MEHDSNTGLLELKQTGLIDRVVEALGLDDGYARCSRGSIPQPKPSLS